MYLVEISRVFAFKIYSIEEWMVSEWNEGGTVADRGTDNLYEGLNARTKPKVARDRGKQTINGVIKKWVE